MNPVTLQPCKEGILCIHDDFVSQFRHRLLSSSLFLLLGDLLLETARRSRARRFDAADTPTDTRLLLFLRSRRSRRSLWTPRVRSRVYRLHTRTAALPFDSLVLLTPQSLFLLPEILPEHFPAFDEFALDAAALIEDDFDAAFAEDGFGREEPADDGEIPQWRGG